MRARAFPARGAYHNIIYRMWANTCPLVDAYSPGHFRRPPPTFFRGPWTGATAERVKGCDARALLRPLLLCFVRADHLCARHCLFLLLYDDSEIRSNYDDNDDDDI